MRQRRRAQRGHFDAPRSAATIDRRSTERRNQRVVLGLGLAAIAVALIVVVAGFYISRVRTPSHVVAQVGQTEIELRELIPFARIVVGTTAATGSSVAISPDNIFDLAVGNEVLRQMGMSGLSVEVTEEEVGLELAAQFDPESTDGTLSEAAQEAYDGVLEAFRVSDEEYRAYVAGEMLRREVSEFFQSIAPREAEAMLIDWIVARDSGAAQAAFERIQGGEAFADVAAEANIERVLADESGRVGWVPRGAFPEFEETVFGAMPGDLLGPIDGTSFGSVIIQVVDGPTEATIDEDVHTVVAANDADSWFREQYLAIVEDVDFGQAQREWLLDNIGE